MSKEMLNALDVLEAEKGIPKDTVIEALQAALVSAYKRHYGQASNVEVEFEPKKGNIHVYAVKEVTEEVFDSQLEVSLKDAVALNGAYEIGDKIIYNAGKAQEQYNVSGDEITLVFFENGKEKTRTVVEKSMDLKTQLIPELNRLPMAGVLKDQQKAAQEAEKEAAKTAETQTTTSTTGVAQSTETTTESTDTVPETGE